jgi:uncharacterized protein
MNNEHQRTLLDIAVRALHDSLVAGRAELPDANGFDPALQAPGATFVTLERDDQLLGCIGTLEPVRPLALDVAHNALAAAFADPRLPPVTADDYPHMAIKISLLSAPEPLPASSYDGVVALVRAGVDGLLLEAGDRRSTLLPSVWPKVDGTDEFLEVLWRKAGVTPRVWANGTRVSRYTTEEFADAGPRRAISADGARARWA